jgi:hypothetical protein
VAASAEADGMDWKKTRTKALDLGVSLMALHASHGNALDAAANVGLFNHESQLMLRPRSQALNSEPTDRPSEESS